MKYFTTLIFILIVALDLSCQTSSKKVNLFNKEFPVLQTGTVKLRYSGRDPQELPPVWGEELTFLAESVPISQIKKFINPQTETKIAHYQVFINESGVVCMQIDQPLGDYEAKLLYFVRDDCQAGNDDCVWGVLIHNSMDQNNPIICLGHYKDGNSIAVRMETLRKIGVIE